LYIGLPSKVWRTFVWSSPWFVNDHNDDPSTSTSLIKSTSGTSGCSVLSVLSTTFGLSLSVLDKDTTST
jgi:hypothetical protein